MMGLDQTAYPRYHEEFVVLENVCVHTVIHVISDVRQNSPFEALMNSKAQRIHEEITDAV